MNGKRKPKPQSIRRASTCEEKESELPSRSVYLCAVSAYVFGLASDLRESAEMASLSNSPLDRRHRPASLLVSRSRFLEFRLQLFDGGEIPPQVRRQACGQAILRHANGLRGIVKRVFSYDHVL